MGFIVRSGLRQDPVGFYPAFSPLPRTILGVDQTRLWSTYGQNGTGRYIFWDTFRYPGIASRVPSFSRGMPPYGVRTFLWRMVKPASDRLPRLRLYHSQSLRARAFRVPGSKKKAEVRRQNEEVRTMCSFFSLLNSSFCLLPSYFCLFLRTRHPAL